MRLQPARLFSTLIWSHVFRALVILIGNNEAVIVNWKELSEAKINNSDVVTWLNGHDPLGFGDPNLESKSDPGTPTMDKKYIGHQDVIDGNRKSTRPFTHALVDLESEVTRTSTQSHVSTENCLLGSSSKMRDRPLIIRPKLSQEGALLADQKAYQKGIRIAMKEINSFYRELELSLMECEDSRREKLINLRKIVEKIRLLAQVLPFPKKDQAHKNSKLIVGSSRSTDSLVSASSTDSRNSMNSIADLKLMIQNMLDEPKSILNAAEIKFELLLLNLFDHMANFLYAQSGNELYFLQSLGLHLANYIKSTDPDLLDLLRQPFTQVVFKERELYSPSDHARFHYCHKLTESLSHKEKGVLFASFISKMLKNYRPKQREIARSPFDDIISKSGFLKNNLDPDCKYFSYVGVLESPDDALVNEMRNYLKHPPSAAGLGETEYLWVFQILTYKMRFSDMNPKNFFDKYISQSFRKEFYFLEQALLTFTSSRTLYEIIEFMTSLQGRNPKALLQEGVLERIIEMGINHQELKRNNLILRAKIEAQLFKASDQCKSLTRKSKELKEWFINNPIQKNLYETAYALGKEVSRTLRRFHMIYEAFTDISTKCFEEDSSTRIPIGASQISGKDNV